MAERFGLITHQALESDWLSGEEDQPGCAIATGKIEKVRPELKQRSKGRNVAGGRPAGARTGAEARARSTHGYASARGEVAAKVTAGEIK